MGKKFVSKPDVMSSSGVMYPYVCKKTFLQDAQNFQQQKSCQWINLFFFLNLSIYLLIYL